jgi:hypothetical protein
MDKTGPSGQGPLTGRQRGLCKTKSNRGFGRGRGCGLGRRNGFGGRFSDQSTLVSDTKDDLDDIAFWENEKKQTC